MNNLTSRRQFLATTGIAASGFLLSPYRIFAQDTSPVIRMKNAAKTDPVHTRLLRADVHVLEGSGGNIACFTGSDGKLQVDAGIAGSRPRIEQALATIGKAPVKQLINTHWHFDHTDGNEWLHREGAIITAHENTLKHLSHTTRIDDWNYTFPASPKGALPTIVIKEESTLHFNGRPIILKKYEPAHTDGDLFVYFPDADILHVADTWWNGFYPFIDYSHGGNIDGMIKATERSLSMVTEKTIIVPGHGPVGDRAQMTEYGDMLVSVREAVRKLKQQGKSQQEAIAAKPTRAFDAKWGNAIIDPAFFTRLVYVGV